MDTTSDGCSLLVRAVPVCHTVAPNVAVDHHGYAVHTKTSTSLAWGLDLSPGDCRQERERDHE